jgi:cold shock CspA family protein
MRGTVAEFDFDKGYGVLAGDSRSYFFHCTQITDGTRTIPVGAAVMFEIRPWHRGEFEAVEITEVVAHTPLQGA